MSCFGWKRIVLIVNRLCKNGTEKIGTDFTEVAYTESVRLTSKFASVPVKTSGTNRFTLQMLSRDILVQEDRIIRALKK